MATNNRPLWKTKQPKKSSQKAWLKTRAVFLNTVRNEEGFYVCANCGRWLTDQEVEVDHLIKRSVAPDRVHDLANLQVLDSACHQRKDSGLTYK